MIYSSRMYATDVVLRGRFCAVLAVHSFLGFIRFVLYVKSFPQETSVSLWEEHASHARKCLIYMVFYPPLYIKTR